MLILLLLLQEPEEKPPIPEKHKTVVVTATKDEKPVEQIGASITVIEPKDGSRDLQQHLRAVPGLAVVQTGSRGGETSVFARGGEADYNLVMLDGIKLNRGGGAFNFAPLVIDNIGRVEIVRGPSSGLYGSSALTSAINMISSRGSGPPKASLLSMAGNYGTVEERLSLLGGEERWSYSLSLGRYDTEGLYSLNSYANNTTFKGHLEWDPGNRLHVALTGAFIASVFNFPTDFVPGARGGFPPVDPRQGEETEQQIIGVALGHVLLEGWEHRLNVSVSSFSNRFYDPLDPIPSDFAAINSVSNERRYDLDYRHHIGKALVGIELEQQQLDQDGLTRIRRTVAVYGQHQFEFFEALFITVGARLDENTEFGTAVSPRGSIAWKIGEFRLRGAAGVGIKEPTFFENFGGFGIAGNPNLDAERSRSFEAGADFEGVSVTFFHNAFDDMIAFTGATFRNIQSAETYGIEASASRAFDAFTVGLSYTWLQTRVIDGGSSEFVDGRPLLRRPTNSGSAWVQYRLDAFEITVTALMVGPRADRDFGRFPEQRVHLPGYVRVDLSASYAVVESVKVRLSVQNLLNTPYEEVFGSRAYGFMFLAGLEVRP